MMERIAERRKAAGEGGFTLIELLVVIIILGILAAVVVFAVGGVGDKGQSSACKIDTRTIRTAEEAMYAQTGAYAQSTNTPATPPGGQATALPSDETALVSGGFLSENSTLHYVSDVVGGTTPSFKIRQESTKCSGALHAVVDGGVGGF